MVHVEVTEEELLILLHTIVTADGLRWAFAERFRNGRMFDFDLWRRGGI